MKPQIRNCENCHYWKDVGANLGDCNAPLPISVSAFFVRRKLTLKTSGSDCKAHKMRTVRKAAKVEQGVQQ